MSPKTQLHKKGNKFNFSCECIDAFAKSKSLLPSLPVLCAPDFDKEFKLAVNASDVGAGVLLQEGDDKIDHPVIIPYFTRFYGLLIVNSNLNKVVIVVNYCFTSLFRHKWTFK